MKWQGREESSNIEDRTGQGGGGMGGGFGGGLGPIHSATAAMAGSAFRSAAGRAGWAASSS